MQPPSKQHVLLNEEAMINKRDDPQLDDTAPVPSSVQSDPEYEPVAKRRKVSPAVEEGALAKRHLDIDAEAVETKAAITASNADQNTMVDAETDTNFTKAPASDADWLRSRTSRLLGLLEDDEVDDAPNGTRSTIPDGATLNVAEETTESKFSDSGGKTNGEMVDAEMSTSPQQKDETYSLEAGRLFIRNLPYQASNKDLRQHFSAYGPIEEV
jgi:multiple RNA-binding domain-containing protein 1